MFGIGQPNNQSVFGNNQTNTNTQNSVFGSNNQQATSGQLFGGILNTNQTASTTSTSNIFGAQGLGIGANLLSNTNQQNTNTQTQLPTQNSNLATNANQSIFNINNTNNPPTSFSKQNSFAFGGGINTAPTPTAASNPLTLNNQNPTTQTNNNTTNTLNYAIGGQNA